MDEKEHDVSTGILEPEGRKYCGKGIVRAIEGSGEPIEFSYLVVHTQKSIRLLDLRIAADDGVDFRHLQQLLRAIEGSLTVDCALAILRDDYTDIRRSVDRRGWTEGLNY